VINQEDVACGAGLGTRLQLLQQLGSFIQAHPKWFLNDKAGGRLEIFTVLSTILSYVVHS
jgi:hypothetical protein